MTSKSESHGFSLKGFTVKKHVCLAILLLLTTTMLLVGNACVSFFSMRSPISMDSVSQKSSPVTPIPWNPHLNPSQLKSYLQEAQQKHNGTLQIEDVPVPLIFPEPQLDRSVEIYNEWAWTELRNRLATQENFTCLVNGGSSSAGAGTSALEAHFPYALEQYLKGEATMNEMIIQLPKKLRPFSNGFEIIHRAHGYRNSLDSAMLMDFYIPEDLPDLIIWEFAINDEDKKGARESVKNQFIFWLDQVARIAERRKDQKPPLVILLYLWDSPFALREGKMSKSVFEAHHRIADKYPFVVGHANVASYFDEIIDDDDIWSVKLLHDYFVADLHHPNDFGHLVMAYLIYDLIQNESRLAGYGSTPFSSSSASSSSTSLDNMPTTFLPTRSEYQWSCRRNNRKLDYLRERVAPVRHQSPEPLATFTRSIPMNEEPYGRMLYTNTNTTNWETNIGKAIPQRRDRHGVIKIPCCARNQTLELASPQGKIEDFRLFMLGIIQVSRDIQISLDGKAGLGVYLKDPGTKGCMNKMYKYYGNLQWYGFNQNMSASTIGFCSNDSCCKAAAAAANSTSEVTSCSMLQTLVVF